MPRARLAFERTRWRLLASSVVDNSRGPQTLKNLAEEVGSRARAATPTEAATEGDLVMVGTPPRAYLAGTCSAIGREACHGHDQLHPAA
ncbi:MAG TPA: NAD(P)-binding domain-containing protein [Candidatus Dormibacteraeota bacterium]